MSIFENPKYPTIIIPEDIRKAINSRLSAVGIEEENVCIQDLTFYCFNSKTEDKNPTPDNGYRIKYYSPSMYWEGVINVQTLVGHKRNTGYIVAIKLSDKEVTYNSKTGLLEINEHVLLMKLNDAVLSILDHIDCYCAYNNDLDKICVFHATLTGSKTEIYIDKNS